MVPKGVTKGAERPPGPGELTKDSEGNSKGVRLHSIEATSDAAYAEERDDDSEAARLSPLPASSSSEDPR